FEEQLGIFKEVPLQTATLSYDAAMHLSNVVYFYSHWPVIIAVAIWLFIKHPRIYSVIRNAFLVTGAIALIVYFAFPVAPPHLAANDVAYTLKHSLIVTYNDSPLVNPFAAIPSMRIGLDLLIAFALFAAFRRGRVRYLFFLFPIVAWISTVTTGMHYIIDGVAGMSVALVGLLVVVWFHRTWPQIETRLPAWLSRS
ncbi:MAG: phosphatase PAP2 family protein, partial [Anaerolineae bacterium]